ncbi:MAG: U32 family peptidase [Erysipelotrichaceae bacterium]|nr:U32 family peptidase [Erysipelotrichaceae bacterium]
MSKIELLAPAKDLFKAKIAIDYGADAIYIGGKSFSLRSRASNFDYSDIKEIVEYAHGKGAKVYVTANIVFHDEDFKGIREYLKTLENFGVDGMIVSSLFVASMIKKAFPKLEAHISTQQSVINSEAVATLKSYGVDRVVLGRECSMEEIRNIATTTTMPLEVFIHGGMCSNYSGRCVLSNRMTNRDANRGGCAHSCRWKYDVYKNGELVSDKEEPFSMSSKDLNAISYVVEMIQCGVTSLKIEGRMKSEYYIAQVVKTYRKLIDEYYELGMVTPRRIRYYANELLKAENRPSDTGFLSGKCDDSKHLYDVNGAGVTHDYVGLVKAYDEKKGIATVEVKNMFDLNDTLEVFGPTIDNEKVVNKLMFDKDWNLLKEAHKPTELVYIRLPFAVSVNDMIRKAK